LEVYKRRKEEKGGIKEGRPTKGMRQARGTDANKRNMRRQTFRQETKGETDP